MKIYSFKVTDLDDQMSIVNIYAESPKQAEMVVKHEVEWTKVERVHDARLTANPDFVLNIGDLA